MTRQDEWNNASGCFWKHMKDKNKRAECERIYQSQKDASVQSDLILAQAAAQSAAKPSGKWTATQTFLVIGGALVGLTIMTAVIIKIKKSK